MVMRTLPKRCLRFYQNEEFHCKICSKVFKSKEAILQHLMSSQKQNVHNVKNHRCVTCDLTLSHSEYIDHLNVANVHKTSVHMYSCTGDNRNLSICCRNTNELNRMCRSHRINSSFEEEKDIGFSPLHCATLHGFHKCLRTLLRWGADPNLKDTFGWTPVHIAAAIGDVEAIMLLLRHHGNLFQLTDDNETPYDVASFDTKYEILNTIFYFEVSEGQARVAKMKDQYLAQIVIGQFEDFKEAILPKDGDCIQSSTVRSLSVSNDQQEESTEETNNKGSTISYADLSGSEIAKSIYDNVLRHGKEKVTHARVLVLGPVGAGKSTLVSNLSGKDFSPERVETEGIKSIFVDTINLDHSWQKVEDSCWKCDEAIARQIAEYLLNMLKTSQGYALTEQVGQLAIGDAASLPVAVPTTSICVEEPIKEKIMEKLERPEKAEEQFKMCIWDFAGNDLYQTMHHIFLSSKAIYLVCMNMVELQKDPSKYIDELNFWLNSITAHKTACEPSGFLVATHLDKVGENVFEEACKTLKARLFEKFPTFFNVCNTNKIAFPIDNTKGPDDPNLKNLQQRIQEVAQESREFIDEIKIQWLQCENELLRFILNHPEVFSKTKDDIRNDILQETCENMPKDEFEDMLKQFHHSGVLWLPELIVKDPDSLFLLRETVVLNVQHLMDAMAVVCQLAYEHDAFKSERKYRDIASILKEDAKISHGDFKTLTERFNVPCDEMIELLRIFNILLPAENIRCSENSPRKSVPTQTSTPKGKGKSSKGDIYVIPSLLQPRNFDQYWEEECDGCKQYIFYIDFFKFVPLAVFDQLLVQAADLSIASKGFEPLLSRSDAIFGFTPKFAYRLKFIETQCQIKGFLRANHSGKPGELLEKIKEMLSSICSNFFKYQKFKIGPSCPSEKCPGAKQDGTKAKKYLKDSTDGACKDNSKPFVIDFDARSQDPIYCGTKLVNEHPDVKIWSLAAEENSFANASAVEFSHSESVDSGVSDTGSAGLVPINQEMKQQVSETIGKDWPKFARCLHFSKHCAVDAIIEQIRADYPQDQREQSCQLLVRWEKDRGDEATLNDLQQALIAGGRKDIADKICKFTFPSS